MADDISKNTLQDFRFAVYEALKDMGGNTEMMAIINDKFIKFAWQKGYKPEDVAWAITQ